ncbi:AMP-binding protein [Streptomyces sp. KL116D]|uniref:AMP-binding protein n=1 Tax=Streptomyces sp. KL116D TaxID=3045152 RepID=UPI00355837E1
MPQLRDRGGAGGRGGRAGRAEQPQKCSPRGTRRISSARAVCYLRTTNPGTRATVLPLDHQIQILRETGTVTVFADAEGAERAAELADASGIPVTRVRDVDRPDGADAPDVPQVEAWEPDALAFIGHTSGSTGRPKGIQASGRAWEATLQAWMGLGRQADCASILVSTPLSHARRPDGRRVPRPGRGALPPRDVRRREVRAGQSPRRRTSRGRSWRRTTSSSSSTTCWSRGSPRATGTWRRPA